MLPVVSPVVRQVGSAEDDLVVLVRRQIVDVSVQRRGGRAAQLGRVQRVVDELRAAREVLLRGVTR